MRRALIALAAMLSLSLLAGGCGGDDNDNSVEILSPKDDAAVAGTTLVARVRAEGPEFKAILEGRDVTERFGDPSNGVRSATFRRDRDFELGSNALLVSVGDIATSDAAAATAHFRAVRRDNSGFRLSPSARLSEGGLSPRADAPAQQFVSTARNVPVQAPSRCRPHDPDCRTSVTLRARSSKRVVAHRTYINGRLVTDPPTEHRDGKGITHDVSANDGLRPGPNRVTTEVEHQDHTLARQTRIVTLPQNRLLADAGRDQAVPTGHGEVLDASKSVRGGAGGQLSYSWRVVSAPKGAKPKLVEETSAADKSCALTDLRCRLVPDKVGNYRVQIDVSAPGGQRAVDEATITAGPTDDPMGVPIQTISNRDDNKGGIQIGSAKYGKKGNWIHLLILDPQTLTPVSGGDKSYRLADAESLSKDLDSLATSQTLVVLSGQGNDWTGRGGFRGLPQNAADALHKAFQTLGGTTDRRGPTSIGATSLATGNWSLIGRVGLPSGAAWQNYEVQQGSVRGSGSSDHGQRGSLNGYLQQVVGRNYDYVSTEYAKLDTKAQGSTASKNVMKVGDATYPSDALSGGGKAQGFQLLVLDGSDLSKKANMTFQVRKSDGTLDDTQMRALADRLTDLIQEPNARTGPDRLRPPFVALQSFGSAKNGGLQPLGNQGRWVADYMYSWQPHKNSHGNYEFFKWCGGDEANKTFRGDKCGLYEIDPQTMPGNNHTVTRAIGLMAGGPARVATANIGRKTAGQTEDENMVAVGPAHPYNNGQVTVKVGNNGDRLVTNLRRTNQSQWRTSAPTSSDKLDTSDFWDLAFQNETDWPRAPTTDDLRDAHFKLALAVFGPTADCIPAHDVRACYPDNLSGSSNWNTRRDILVHTEPDAGKSDSYKSDFLALRDQLRNEFDQIAFVEAMVDNYENVFGDAKANAILDVESIGGTVASAATTDQENRLLEEAELDEEAPVGDALYFVADLFALVPEYGELAGGPIAFFASAWDLFSNISSADRAKHDDATHLPNYPQLIRDQAINLGKHLSQRYASTEKTLEHLAQIYVSDYTKLKTASDNANGGKWQLTKGTGRKDTKQVLSQALSVGAQSEFYEAVMPVAYNQFFLSPVFTYTGNDDPKDVTTVGPKSYNCDSGPNPFEHAPDAAVHWVRTSYSGVKDDWDNTGGARKRLRYQNHSVGRGLKSKSDPLTTQYGESSAHFGSNFGEFVDTKHGGADPTTGKDGTRIDLLFKTLDPNADPPDNLGMDKDEFFGLETWTSPRLQCGPSVNESW